MPAFRQGLTPWLPTETSMSRITLLEVGEPLVGVFHDLGVDYLYSCVLGDLDRLAIWAYVPVSADDLKFLESDPFKEPEELRLWADARTFRHGTFTSLSWDNVVQVHADVEPHHGTIFDSIKWLLDVFTPDTFELVRPWQREPEVGPTPTSDADAQELRDDRQTQVALVKEEARELALANS